MKIKLFQNIVDLIRGRACIARVCHSNKPLTVPYIEPKSTYNKLICVQGFGASGSSAVNDLLSEFDNITVRELGNPGVGFVYPYEIDFFRNYGGVLDLEEAFKIKSLEKRNFKLKNFITLSEWLWSQKTIYTDKYMEITKEFVNSLIDYTIETETGCDVNWAFMSVGNYYSYSNFSKEFILDGKNKKIYRLKNYTVDEYIELAHEYIVKVLKTLESKEYLLLDQFVSEGTTDFDKLRKYIGDFKHIGVYRDPRDVYAEAIQTNSDFWMPRNPELFVKWYLSYTQDFMHVSHKDFYRIRFEDLILDYDTTKDSILRFLGIDPKHHIKPKTFLVPELSAKNIGRWKYLDMPKEIKYIEEHLKEYCYEECND